MEHSNSEFCLELYGFLKVVAKMQERISHLSPEDGKKYSSQISWFLKKADSFFADNSIVFSSANAGDTYDVGLPVTPVNLSDFGTDDELVIDQVVEPTILQNGKVLQKGTVLLKKKAE